MIFLGTGPCNGDSGGGLYLPLKDPEGAVRWYLRGIVSLSLIDTNTGLCDLNHFTVFTDVAQFRTWLQKKIGREDAYADDPVNRSYRT